MERSRAVSEASSSREAPAYDYASLPGYRSSLSYYNQQASLDTQPINRDGHGGYYTDHLSKIQHKEAPGPAGDGISGKYSYVSSYDDMSRRYGYGSDGGSYLSEACKDRAFDGSSAYHHESSYRSSASPRTSGFSQDVGSTYGSRHHAFADEQWISNRYDDGLGSRKDGLGSGSKADVMSHEQSALGGQGNFDYELNYSLKDYNEQSTSKYYAPTKVSVTGAMKDDKSSYLLASKHDTTSSGLYLPSSGASYDWRSAGGIQRAPEELGWKGFSSLSSIGREQGPLDRAGSSSRFMDGSAYPEPWEHGKLSAWNEAAVRLAELDVGRKGNDSLSLLHTEPVANGSKMADTKVASIPVQGVGLPKPANEGTKRRSRWEPVEENEKSGEDGIKKGKKKTRWSAEKSPVKGTSMPNTMKEITADGAEIVALRARLIIINKMLQSGQVLDDLNAERSPSPEPIFDNFGFRINTREYRAREKFNKERQNIMARLSENLTPLKLTVTGGKPSKLYKKIYIPVDKHPDYNFIGLIIGPRGHTQKKMERETGAKIFIRGKGSVKEGASTHLLSDNDSLHVLIEADSEDAINKASEMVKKLLVPVEDGQNELKRAQLRELASMNGTLRISDVCHECREPGHISKECPMRGSAAVSGVSVVQKGGAATDNDVCHVCKGPGPKHLRKECCSTSGSNLVKDDSKGGDNTTSLVADTSIDDENDNTGLYVAYLPSSVDDAQLCNLFSPFGQVVYANVMKHPTTGTSKCYGFVKFADAADAAQAAALMNGYQMDGKVLVVKAKTKSELAS